MKVLQFSNSQAQIEVSAPDTQILAAAMKEPGLPNLPDVGQEVARGYRDTIAAVFELLSANFRPATEQLAGREAVLLFFYRYLPEKEQKSMLLVMNALGGQHS